MDGIELLAAIKEKYPELPVILVTAFGELVRSEHLQHAGLFHKPFDLEELQGLICDVVHEKGLYRFVRTLFPENEPIYRVLYECRVVVRRFLRHYQSNSLFESALRHKIKDTIGEFCRAAEEHTDALELAKRLRAKLARLEMIMAQIKHGSEAGLRKIFDGIKEDVQSERPGIRISLSSLPRLPPTVAGSAIETFLAFCALEFVKNAVDAIKGKGRIWIVLRRKRTSNEIVLAVRNDGPNIADELVDKIFEEGVTTKGDGRGMGLYIIKQLAERFGGTAYLTQDDGVQFLVAVPLKSSVV